MKNINYDAKLDPGICFRCHAKCKCLTDFSWQDHNKNLSCLVSCPYASEINCGSSFEDAYDETYSYYTCHRKEILKIDYVFTSVVNSVCPNYIEHMINHIIRKYGVKRIKNKKPGKSKINKNVCKLCKKSKWTEFDSVLWRRFRKVICPVSDLLNVWNQAPGKCPYNMEHLIVTQGYTKQL